MTDSMAQSHPDPSAGAGASPMSLHLVHGGLDRAAERRADQSWLQLALAAPGARVMWVSHGSVATVGDDAQVGRRSTDPASSARPATSRLSADRPELTFLGLDADGEACFALHADEQLAQLPSGPAHWLTLRELGLRLPERAGFDGGDRSRPGQLAEADPMLLGPAGPGWSPRGCRLGPALPAGRSSRALPAHRSGCHRARPGTTRTGPCSGRHAELGAGLDVHHRRIRRGR
jgi:hypothetical protein